MTPFFRLVFWGNTTGRLPNNNRILQNQEDFHTEMLSAHLFDMPGEPHQRSTD